MPYKDPEKRRAQARAYNAAHRAQIRAYERSRSGSCWDRADACYVCLTWHRLTRLPMRCPLCDPAPLGALPAALVLNAMLFAS